jgi:hypothetical protein
MTGIEHFCPAVIGAELRAIAVKKNPQKTILKNFFIKKLWVPSRWPARKRALQAGISCRGPARITPGWVQQAQLCLTRVRKI